MLYFIENNRQFVLSFFAMLFVFVGFMFADCSGGDYSIQIREACSECWKNKNETACRVCEDGLKHIKKFQ